MAPFGPFEPRPLLAVAVSGGADSLALCLLADHWARARGGSVIGLTVDHRLRPEAAAEARQVAAWLAAHGIAHRTLAWRPPDGLRNLQAAARTARYALLDAWCRDSACLHLLTAHHREDQAETFLLRLARGSGLDGLASMRAERALVHCRLLRPLLPVPHDRLTASLAAQGQAWIEEPSNRDPRYARVRLRSSAALLIREGLTPSRLAATAQRLGRARAALAAAVAELLAEAVVLYPAGFAWLDATPLSTTPPEIGLRALARLVTTVGGGIYPPRHERLERLFALLAEGLATGRTLGGCRFIPKRGAVLVCREPSAVAPPSALAPGASIRWDGRFAARLSTAAPEGLSLGALGNSTEAPPELKERLATLPGAARPTLPAIRDLAGIVAVPHLHYAKIGREAVAAMIETVAFRPERSLTASGFTVV
jgi:tRNA(Ile)-lysidine synthase